MNNKFSGFLNVNKPQGITSFQVVKHIARITETKTGHLGTLDPIATGVLMVTIGTATRLTQYFIDKTKKYEFTIKFGEATDTLDSEGKVVERMEEFELDREKILDIIPRFIGQIEQVPPKYSAIKYKGKKLYEYSRAGKEIDLSQFKRNVKIFELNLLSMNDKEASFYVYCSGGTYIRSLAYDICRELGIPGHVSVLTRTAIGEEDWGRIENSIDLDNINSLEDIERNLISLDRILASFSKIKLKNNKIFKLKKGQYVPFFKEINTPPPYVILDEDNEIIGIGSIENNHIHLNRML